MLFPQFVIYQNKETLNYSDLSNILLIVINLKETWNYNAFKECTHITWMRFKDKLTYDQKVVYSNLIKKFRNILYNYLIENNSKWVSSSVLLTIYKTDIDPFLRSFSKRQLILKQSVH